MAYRPKYGIALAQLDRAAADGVHLSWITAALWYSQKPLVRAALGAAGIAIGAGNFEEFRGLAPRARPVAYHIKDTEKGPLVWEVKFAPCRLPRWRRRRADRTGW